MKTIKGTFNEAVVYTDQLEARAEEQIVKMCCLPFLKDSRIRVMPDVHAGAGCTIGTTMTITDAVVPNFVGVDIGCGMEVAKIHEKEIDFAALDALIRKEIPSGFEIRKSEHPFNKEIDLNELKCVRQIQLNRAKHSLGTLGGGNHFIEVDQDQEGNLYLVIHSGSRMLGKEIAEYYQNEAFLANHQASPVNIQALIAQMKKEGRETEIQTVIHELKRKLHDEEVEKPFAYCEGLLLDDYLHDMEIIQRFAELNRKAMMDTLIEGLHLTRTESFTTIHNYIDLKHRILRKGSVSAQKGEKLIIPLNMKDGALICIGKGNPQWNYSAPHGAGRLLSRGQASRTLTLEEFQQVMEGIYSTSVSAATLDESPMAYKPKEEIIQNIAETVEIVKWIQPVYNFKAQEQKPVWRKKKE